MPELPSDPAISYSSRIRQMERGDTPQWLENPGQNVDSCFHPLFGSLSPAQTYQSYEIDRNLASRTRKRQSHLANPGSYRFRRYGTCGAVEKSQMDEVLQQDHS